MNPKDNHLNKYMYPYNAGYFYELHSSHFYPINLEASVIAYEPWHKISNIVTFWQV